MAPPSSVVLKKEVYLDSDAVRNKSEWVVIKCKETRSDGCDKALVDAVTLLARVVDPPGLSELSIRLDGDRSSLDSDDSSRSGSDGDGGDDDDNLDAGHHVLPLPRAYVAATDDRLIVLKTDRNFFIYDATDASVSMIPRLSGWSCTPSLTPHPLPVRRRDGDGGYALAIMASYDQYDREARRSVEHDALCLWPPPPSSRRMPRGSIAPWMVKEPRFPPEKPRYFWADVAFSFQGLAFWADLGQGVLFCDCEDVLSGGYEVHFRYVSLPQECQLDHFREGDGFTVRRAMSCCAGDGSIKLVCIGKGCSCEECGSEAPGDMMVAVWALNLATGQWQKDRDEFPVAKMWGMKGFKEAGLPEAVPILPILSTQEDGVLYFALEEKEQDLPWRRLHLGSLHMRAKSFLPSGLLSEFPLCVLPHVFASDFFKNLDDKYLSPLATAEAELFPVPPKRGRGEQAEED